MRRRVAQLKCYIILLGCTVLNPVSADWPVIGCTIKWKYVGFYLDETIKAIGIKLYEWLRNSKMTLNSYILHFSDVKWK